MDKKSIDHGVQLTAHVAPLLVFLEGHKKNALPTAALSPEPSDLIFLDFARHGMQMFALVLDNKNSPVRKFANKIREKLAS